MDELEWLEAAGFENLEEFNHLVASVDLTTDDGRDAFKIWQYLDGSKHGLLRILQLQDERNKRR